MAGAGSGSAPYDVFEVRRRLLEAGIAPAGRAWPASVQPLHAAAGDARPILDFERTLRRAARARGLSYRRALKLWHGTARRLSPREGKLTVYAEEALELATVFRERRPGLIAALGWWRDRAGLAPCFEPGLSWPSAAGECLVFECASDGAVFLWHASPGLLWLPAARGVLYGRDLCGFERYFGPVRARERRLWSLRDAASGARTLPWLGRVRMETPAAAEGGAAGAVLGVSGTVLRLPIVDPDGRAGVLEAWYAAKMESAPPCRAQAVAGAGA